MIYIFYSCYNNYDLLIGENSNFLKRYSDRIILIDDHSSKKEQEKGRMIAKNYGIRFEINPGKVVQSGLAFIIKNICKSEDWVLTIQQDVNFLDTRVIEKLEKRIKGIQLKKYKIGAIGFPNYVPNAHYHKNKNQIRKICWRECWLGVFNLSNSSTYKTGKFIDTIYRMISKIPYIKHIERRFWQKVIFHRNFAPLTYPKFGKIIRNYDGLVSIDLPVWSVITISAKAWKEAITPDPNFIFHLWFPDIALQFLNKNWFVCLDTKFVVINNTNLKLKYGIKGSVLEGKNNSPRMENYGNHFKTWYNKWKFDYEDPFPNYEKNEVINKNSLLHQMFGRSSNEPVKKFMV